MSGSSGDGSAEAYRSASELGEYAFCPRAQYYRHHPPGGPPNPQTEQDVARGDRYHERSGAAILRRQRSARAWVWVLLAAGGGLAALVVIAWVGLP